VGQLSKTLDAAHRHLSLLQLRRMQRVVSLLQRRRPLQAESPCRGREHSSGSPHRAVGSSVGGSPRAAGANTASRDAPAAAETTVSPPLSSSKGLPAAPPPPCLGLQHPLHSGAQMLPEGVTLMPSRRDAAGGSMTQGPPDPEDRGLLSGNIWGLGFSESRTTCPAAAAASTMNLPTAPRAASVSGPTPPPPPPGTCKASRLAEHQIRHHVDLRVGPAPCVGAASQLRGSARTGCGLVAASMDPPLHPISSVHPPPAHLPPPIQGQPPPPSPHPQPLPGTPPSCSAAAARQRSLPEGGPREATCPEALRSSQADSAGPCSEHLTALRQRHPSRSPFRTGFRTTPASVPTCPYTHNSSTQGGHPYSA